MATVYVSLGYADTLRGVFTGLGQTETITSSTTAASGTLKAGPNTVAQIFCASAVIANVAGPASASNGFYVPAGQIMTVGIPAGKSVSVIDA